MQTMPSTRSTNAKDAPTTRVLRTRRAVSAQPTQSTIPSSRAATRPSQKVSKAQSNRTRRAATVPPASTLAPLPELVKFDPPTSKAPPTAHNLPTPPLVIKSGYGDAHAFNEHQGMLAFAAAARSHNLLDEETLEALSKPWQEKGTMDMQWKPEYLDASKKAPDDEVMDLKQAELIARRKDAAEKKFLKDFYAGKIDENGNKIDAEVTFLGEKKSSATTKNSKGKAKEKEDEKKEPLKKVTSGKITKKPPANKSKTKVEIITFEVAKVLPIAEAPTPTSQNPPSLEGPRTKATNPNPPPVVTNKNPPAVSQAVTPLPVRPSYDEYTYYQLAALCFERNLVSGGKENILRNRLVQDDINVIQGLPREAKTYAKEKDRARKHKAPVVPGAPPAPPAVALRKSVASNAKKRGRENDDETDDVGVKKVRVQ